MRIVQLYTFYSRIRILSMLMWNTILDEKRAWWVGRKTQNPTRMLSVVMGML